MSNITQQNNIRYNIDKLNTQSFGVIYTKSNAINLTNATRITGINITGSQPANTSRYFAFKVNNTWGKLSSTGTFTAFTDQTLSYENLAKSGNTAAELSSLTSIPALAGQRIDTAIALSSDDPINSGVPSAALSFKCIAGTQTLTHTETSPIYEIGSDSQILKLSTDTSSSNGGSVSVSARITRPDGTVSDWGTLDSFTGQRATRVEFRGDYRATTVGTSTAKIDRASVLYADGSSILSGSNDGELITLTQDWYMPVKSCRLTVKHAPLENSGLSAYVALRSSPVQVKGETLGTGSGARKVYQLSHTDGLKYDTLRLYYDNVQVYSDYEFNCEAGRVTCEAPEGVIVTADYERGWTVEEWEPMSLSSRLSMDGYDQSEYRYSNDDITGKSVCALKIVMTKTSGHITNERLGLATGKTQSFRLSRRIKDGAVSITANGATLAAKNWSLLDDPQHVAVTAPYGQTIRASYDWISETPAVYEFFATWLDSSE